MDTRSLQDLLTPFGLHIRGKLDLSQNDLADLDLVGNSESPCSLTLIGNIGSSFWPVFSTSEEFKDSKSDPLDRWSRRIAEQLAIVTGAIALYPFDGPPYFPFQQWAQRAEELTQSPLGLMIHPQFGLWHAYRFALVMAGITDGVETGLVESPCVSCRDQPCLNTCPVDAFSQNGYDVKTCAEYLKQDPAADCHSQGCIARLACPVGASYRYQPEQNAFHLKAFASTR